LSGARIIQKVLSDPELLIQWQNDLNVMVVRMKTMRANFKQTLIEVGCKPPNDLNNWDHITNQIGMFCYTGLTSIQVHHLIKDYDI